MDLRKLESVKERREALEKKLGISLVKSGKHSLDETTASARNCENMIGAAQVPLGIAGPLLIMGQGTRDKGQEYYLPLATTEGALVASVNRGCKAISLSGGAKVLSNKDGVTRGPVFKVKNMAENSVLFEFLDKSRSEMEKITLSTSSHLKLTDVFTRSVGLYRFVRFSFDSGDAMGMNMATIATDKMVKFIEEKTGASCVSLSGNFCTDKKASWQNFVLNRGFEVWAEAVLNQEALDLLKTTAEAFYQTWLAKCMIGSSLSGSMGFNAQYANILAAMFIATGQDPAHVAECAVGITTAEIIKEQGVRSKGQERIKNLPAQAGKELRIKNQDDSGQARMTDKEIHNSKLKINSLTTNYQTAEAQLSRAEAVELRTTNSLYVSIYLPDLMVGTVGGGTGLATQKEALDILGIAGGNEGKNAQKLAEVTGAAVLAGEISLIASLAEGSLVRAHRALARGIR